MDTQVSGGSVGYVYDDVKTSLGAVLIETFLYGIYTILFMICAYIIFQRRHNVHWTFPVLGLALYTVASADIAYMMWLTFGNSGLLPLKYVRPKQWLFIINSFFADTLLLYRCSIVWNRDKRAMIFPAFLLIATTVCGCAFAASSQKKFFEKPWVYLFLSFVLNVTLTALTASRIWWISRKARQAGLWRQCNGAVVILIESGFIYSLYIILDFAVFSTTAPSILLDTSLTQVAGIMPTLILAQVSLGHACQDVEAKPTVAHPRGYTNDKAGTQPDTLQRDQHLDWNHFRFSNNNDEDISLEDRVHRNKVNELGPESGLGKGDQ